jgi:hypothetical protein
MIPPADRRHTGRTVSFEPDERAVGYVIAGLAFSSRRDG